jgi:hypothetical protein
MSAFGKRRELRRFQPCTPQVVRDSTLNGAPVLLLGWWLGVDGETQAAQVLTLTSERRPHELAGWHGEPVLPLADVQLPLWPRYGGSHPQGED